MEKTIKYLRELASKWPGYPIPVEIMDAEGLANLLESYQELEQKLARLEAELEADLGTHYSIIGGEVLELDGSQIWSSSGEDEIPF